MGQTQSRGSVKTVNRWLQGANFARPALTSPDEGALLAEDDDLGAHGLPRLLDGQVAFFVHVDDGDRGVHASPSHHRRDYSAGDHCHAHTQTPVSSLKWWRRGARRCFHFPIELHLELS